MVLIGFLIMKHTKKEGVKESFVDEKAYMNRLNVMKIFDSVLNRKPTPEEIEKFATADNEQDMLENIVNDLENIINKYDGSPTAGDKQPSNTSNEQRASNVQQGTREQTSFSNVQGTNVQQGTNEQRAFPNVQQGTNEQTSFSNVQGTNVQQGTNEQAVFSNGNNTITANNELKTFSKDKIMSITTKMDTLMEELSNFKKELLA